MSIPLKPIRHSGSHGPMQTKCGPAAIAAVTGRSRECAAAWINRVRRHPITKKVGAVYMSEIRSVLERLGYKSDRKRLASLRLHGRRPTLHTWLKHRTPEEYGQAHVILITGHFVVVRGAELFDSANPSGISIGDYRRKKSRVQEVISVSPSEHPAAKAMREIERDPIPRRDFAKKS